MHFGAQLVNYFTTWEATLPTIKMVESGRWNSLWWSDHFLPPAPGRPDIEDQGAMEGWSLLTAAAAITNRVDLGLLVTGNTYRNPALLAKMAGTIDEISGGRLIIGIGAAWFKREHEAYGWTFPELKERCDRLEEACEMLKLIFTADEPVSFNGRYYTLDNAPSEPSFYAKATHATTRWRKWRETNASDVCQVRGLLQHRLSIIPAEPDVFRRKIEVLARHCDSIGRDPGEIKKTVLIPMYLEDDDRQAQEIRRQRGGWGMYGSPSYCIDLIGQYIEAGAEEMMFSAVPTRAEYFDRIDRDVLSAFD